MDADVIVVGAGLAGLVATHELTSGGKKVAPQRAPIQRERRGWIRSQP